MKKAVERLLFLHFCDGNRLTERVLLDIMKGTEHLLGFVGLTS